MSARIRTKYHDLVGEYFANEDHSLKDLVLNAIAISEKTIDLFMHTFTDMDIASKIIDAQKRNVKVRILVDNEQYRSSSAMKKCIDYLKSNKVDVQSIENIRLNHRCMIVDQELVLNGSYDYTYPNEYGYISVNHSENITQKWVDCFEQFWWKKRQIELQIQYEMGKNPNVETKERIARWKNELTYK